MKRLALWIGLAGACAGASCGQLPQLGPQQAEPAAPAAAPAAAPDISGAIGRDYEYLAASQPRFTATGLGLAGDDAARFVAAMGVGAPSWALSGGGAEALVFSGCAAEGCAAGRAVLAVDAASGAAFAGVADAQGAEILAPNPRLETLLRLYAPSRHWIDARPAPNTAPAPTAP